jgi:phenylacetate-CoA ligase
MFDTIKSFLHARHVSTWPRAKVIAYQKKMLELTLIDTYQHSVFYRELWSKAGINRDNVLSIPLAKFPIVDKKQLMENFDNVVTQPGITKESVETFVQSDPYGSQKYQNRYIVTNTSGSSGYVGVFLFDKKLSSNLFGTGISRLVNLPISDFVTGKVTVAFIGEASGHHAGVSLVRAAPSIFKTMSADVSTDPEKLAEKMTAFNPSVLSGYSSGLAVLAKMQKEAKIKLAPKIIISSGEPLSRDREELIKEAFLVRPIDFYGCTECLTMAASLYDSDHLDFFDDILYTESVDDNNQPAAPGELGRIVITVFRNGIQPLIRYALDDEIALEPESLQYPFTRSSKVTGRKLERLKVTLANGKILEVHPMDLVGLFFPGLKQYQIVQTAPTTVTMRLVADGDKKKILDFVTKIADELIKEKGLKWEDVDLKLEFVDKIDPNPKTGKTPIILPFKS